MMRCEPTTCGLCKLNYLSGDSDDERTHRKHCRRWTEAVNALGYEPRAHADREDMKRAGYAMKNDNDIANRVRGMEMVLRGQFDRSLSAAIQDGYWRRHPDFPTYVAMRDIDPFDDFGRDAALALRRKYGRRIAGIPDGRSYWLPASNPGAPR